MVIVTLLAAYFVITFVVLVFLFTDFGDRDE